MFIKENWIDGPDSIIENMEMHWNFIYFHLKYSGDAEVEGQGILRGELSQVE